MLASVPSLDLSVLVQIVVAALVVGISLLYLVKATASRYFVVEARFDGGGVGVDARGERAVLTGTGLPGRGQMEVGTENQSCFVCGNSSNKRCATCKAVRYCSVTCQSKHWKEDHKSKCKEFKLSSAVNPLSSASSSIDNGRKKLSLVPSRGSCKVLQQPKKVLFPYDEFVKLFNWGISGFPPCGLLNCGNSCFANVVLQCLSCTRPLFAFLLGKGHSRKCRRNDWCFLCEFQIHIHRAGQSSHPFSPTNILSRLPNIGGNLGCGKQEDAHEFMRFAIDTMQSICLDEFGGEKVLDLSAQESTLIYHIFGGHLQSQVICTKCDKISYRYENMMDLTVEIQGDFSSLEDCLDQFTMKEWLDGENMYKCDGCNDYVKAWKRLTIHQAPNILTIALKRFQSGRFGKLNKRVTFPETLDLSPYMNEAGDGTDLYKLYAIIVHVDMLNASYFGHYICYTKDFGGNWYRVDDSKVMQVELEEVLAQGAYMLLYSRVRPRQPQTKSREQPKEVKKQVEVSKEDDGSRELIEPPGNAISVDSASAPDCELNGKIASLVHKKELDLLDMANTTDASLIQTEQHVNGACLGSPDSCSIGSSNIDNSCPAHCSSELEDFCSAEFSNRDTMNSVSAIELSNGAAMGCLKNGIDVVNYEVKQEKSSVNSQGRMFMPPESHIGYLNGASVATSLSHKSADPLSWNSAAEAAPGRGIGNGFFQSDSVQNRTNRCFQSIGSPPLGLACRKSLSEELESRNGLDAADIPDVLHTLENVCQVENQEIITSTSYREGGAASLEPEKALSNGNGCSESAEFVHSLKLKSNCNGYLGPPTMDQNGCSVRKEGGGGNLAILDGEDASITYSNGSSNERSHEQEVADACRYCSVSDSDVNKRSLDKNRGIALSP